MRLKAILTGAAASALIASPSTAERASDGDLNILYWQAVSIMTPYLANGLKDAEAASLVLEPLARFDESGAMVPWLAAEIPTLENGGVAEDLTSITWKLQDGLVWSDGSPVTAEDAVFTWEYCAHPEGGCAQLTGFADVAVVEAVDDLTIKVTFDLAKPYPYGPFVGMLSPIIQKAQFADCLGPRMPECSEQNFAPIGTGPFIVTDFKSNDVVTFDMNPNFRDPERPAFSRVIIKGGGDAASAARSVLETGEFDYAWNTQVEPEILAQMAASGAGRVINTFGPMVESIELNQSDPDPALGEDRSTLAHPHPFLTDPAVSRALSLAIDREILVETGYGEAGKVTCNVLSAPEYQSSKNNEWCRSQDIAEASRLLDEAGWTVGADGVREKDGRRLSVLFQTSTNSVRQAAQALIKQWWGEIGVETELRNVDGAVFFGNDPSSPDTISKFYADLQMFASTFAGTDPEAFLGGMACDEIPSPDTQWQGQNRLRFCSEDYDAMIAEIGRTGDAVPRSELAIKMNDEIVEAGVIIPLIHRGRISARANTLGGVRMNAWDSELWNIADWTRVE